MIFEMTTNPAKAQRREEKKNRTFNLCAFAPSRDDICVNLW